MTKPHSPTPEDREMVKTMVAVGIDHASIAMCIQGGIDKKTLYKYYRAEIDESATRANAKVGGTLFQRATAGDVTACIWWTKTRMKWHETKQIDMTHRKAVEELSDADLERIATSRSNGAVDEAEGKEEPPSLH